MQNNTYSVPPRLRGERLVVRLFDLRLEVYYGDKRQLVIERLRGEGKHRIDYRHVIWSLLKKPWAFARYRYRESLFPSEPLCRAYDALVSGLARRVEYLWVLHLAGVPLQPAPDRLVHHAVILELSGPSYRAETAKHRSDRRSETS